MAVRVASQVLCKSSAELCGEVPVRPRPEAGRARGVHGRNDGELHAKMQGLGREVASVGFVAAAARRAPGVLVRAVRVGRSTASPRRRPLDSTSESQSDSRSALSDPAVATTHVSGSARWGRRRAAAFCCFVISLSISLGPVVTVLELVGGLVWDSGRRTGRWSRRVLSPRRTPWLVCAIPLWRMWNPGERLSRAERKMLPSVLQHARLPHRCATAKSLPRRNKTCASR